MKKRLKSLNELDALIGNLEEIERLEGASGLGTSYCELVLDVGELMEMSDRLTDWGARRRVDAVQARATHLMEKIANTRKRCSR